MTNEQFTTLMIEFTKLNHRLEKLEEQVKYVMTPINCGKLDSRTCPIPKEWKNKDAFAGSLDSDDEEFLENFK